MPYYSKEIIQQLKDRADISAVIQQFIPIKRSGTGRYTCVCPFHDDHSPSMSINPMIGIYKCFSCGATGDVFKFVQEHEKIDFYGAIEWVANFVGFDLPKNSRGENSEVTEERQLVRQLNALACEWFENQLSLSTKALEYLHQRHVSDAIRKQFHMGYAPAGREGFIGYAAKNGFSPRDCVKAGLAIEKENGGISDKFRDRLMIAIQNMSGVVVAFGGRDLSNNTEFKPPKYLNSPDTALYQKGDILFGLNHAQNDIRKENAVIIVEGYFDLISLYQSGIRNVVAASGTALTETQASILSRFANKAYLVFDGDAAGQKATQRSLEIVLPKGIAPRIFSLSRPDGTKIDPDNFINERGPDAFREELKGAEDWLSYLSQKMPTQSIEDRATFITFAKSLIKSIENPELQNLYAQQLASRFSTSTSLAQVQPLRAKHKPVQGREEIPAEIVDDQIPWHVLSPIEIRFANLILRNPTLMDRACEYFDMTLAASGIQLLESSIIDEFVNTAIALYSESGFFSVKEFYTRLSPQLQNFLQQLPEESWAPPKEIIEFYETLMVLTLRMCDREKKKIPLNSTENIQKRMDLQKFTQGMQKIEQEYKKGSTSIDYFADQIIKSKEQFIAILAS